LGGASGDPWSRDFPLPDESAGPEDWGDEDLRHAVEYARKKGKHVVGVIAGHMHSRPERSERPLVTERDGISYVNAACVPRIVMKEGSERHHYVEVQLSPTRMICEERWEAVSDSP
jgi:uncharacterized protein (TIGR04168 family)